jgi:hypothetical protein
VVLVAVVVVVLAPAAVVVAGRPTPAARQPPQLPPAPGTAFASLTGAARRFAVKRYTGQPLRARRMTDRS